MLYCCIYVKFVNIYITLIYIVCLYINNKTPTPISPFNAN